MADAEKNYIDEDGKAILKKVSEIIIDNRDNPDNFPIIKKAMDKMYEYFSNYPEETLCEFSFQIEIFRVEQLLKDYFLPINSTPIYNPNENVSFPSKFETEQDCEQAMNFIVHATRTEISKSHNLQTDSLKADCIRTSHILEDTASKNDVKAIPFSVSETLDYGFYHCFTIIKIPLENGSVKSYIADCTYRQFFTQNNSNIKRIAVTRGASKGCSIGTYMMANDERTAMAEQLLTKGYVEATPENLKMYLDAILFSGQDKEHYESKGLDYMNKNDWVPQGTLNDHIRKLVNSQRTHSTSIEEVTNQILRSTKHRIPLSNLRNKVISTFEILRKKDKEGKQIE